MMKVTVLYGNPKSTDEFEKYYESTHLPLAAKMKGVDRLELTKFIPEFCTQLGFNDRRLRFFQLN